MQKAMLLIAASLLYLTTHAQTVTDLFNKRDFKELIKFESKADQLTPKELYMLGYAFFISENDAKALAFYDKAMAKGLDDGLVHFYKGLSLYYLHKYDDALKEVEVALQKEPTNQEYLNQKGMIYRHQGQPDKALAVFEEATKLPNTYGEPFFWVAYSYHEKNDFKKALELYYIAKENVPPTNDRYLVTLQNIGQLEYTFTKDYGKAAEAYALAVSVHPADYVWYPKLIKAYNGNKEYAKADSVFGLLKAAYEKKALPREDMEFKSTAIDESEWNGQRMTVYRSFDEPVNMLDISYKVYLLNKKADKIERTFTIEKTLQLTDKDPKQLLCEQGKKRGSHTTYPYGWVTDTIPLDDLKKAVIAVLEDKMRPAASSR